MLRTASLAALFVGSLTAQCSVQGIFVTPSGTPCNGGAVLGVGYLPGTCELLFSYNPFLAHGQWLALSTNWQRVGYPLVPPACLLFQSPDVIVPIVSTATLAVPSALLPFRFHVDAFALHHEPNTGAWIVRPAQQGRQISLW